MTCPSCVTALLLRRHNLVRLLSILSQHASEVLDRKEIVTVGQFHEHSVRYPG